MRLSWTQSVLSSVDAPKTLINKWRSGEPERKQAGKNMTSEHNMVVYCKWTISAQSRKKKPSETSKLTGPPTVPWLGAPASLSLESKQLLRAQLGV